MTLTIPDIQSITNGSNGYDMQAVTDSTDVTAMQAATAGVAFVISGMKVSPSSGMTVAVAAGKYSVAGTEYVYAGGTAVVAAADATDRRDIVAVDVTGTASAVKGTACGTAGWVRTSSGLPPVKPSIPSSSVLVGEIAVPQGTVTIATANIVDKTTLALVPSGGSPGEVVTSNGSGVAEWEWPFPSFIRVSDHGAAGNLTFGQSASTTASSTTVTLSDASLSAADVGKTLCVNYACAATGGPWTTSIVSVTDATHCVVAAAPTASGSGNYYALGTDDTAAFTSAITAGQALGVARWSLLLDDVGYMIAGPLVTTNGYNTQIPLPYLLAAGNRVAIEIRGKSTRPQNYMATAVAPQPADIAGPILFTAYSNQANNAFSPTVGVPSMIGGPASRGPGGSFTQVCPLIRGVTMFGPASAPATYADFGLCQQAVVENTYSGINLTDSSEVTSGPATNAAVIMPEQGNNDLCELWGFNAAFGTTIGFVLGEHSTAAHLFCYQNVGGVVAPSYNNSYHPTYIGHLETSGCIYHIAGWDPATATHEGCNTNAQAMFELGLWDIQDASSGSYVTTAHVYNGSSHIVNAAGVVRVAAGSGPVAGGYVLNNNNARVLDLWKSRGPLTPPGVPASGVMFPVVFRDTIYVFTANWSNVSSLTIAGVGGLGLASSQNPAVIFVPSGMGLVLTYSGTAPVLSGFIVL